MLETLTKGFRNARLKLQGRTTLSEENISDALRDVRVSLLEADVDLAVVKAFLAKVRERSLGEVVHVKFKRTLPGMPPGFQVTPGDHFVKICHDELVALMGPVDETFEPSGKPAIIMMCGLQGSGKTTTAGKLARMLMKRGRKPMLVAADIYRPAAVEQLTTIGRKIGVPVFSIRGMDPVALCKAAVSQARNVGRDVVIFDTAGRLAIDNKLMGELVEIKAQTSPGEILFVCDAMIGQDAVRSAAEFDRLLDFTGFVLTKLDGDARGGAALSIKEVTGKPIRFLGMGEGLDKLDEFRPEGLASRILGMGDVVGLVKDFEEHVSAEDAERDARKMLSGDFTFDDFIKQLEMIQKMGSLKDLMAKLPFFGDMQIPDEALDDNELVRVKSMIQSMTNQERREPDLLQTLGRVRRVARGSGHSDQDVRDLLDRFNMARKMMKDLGSGGGLMSAMAGGGGMPAFPGMGGMPGLGGGRKPKKIKAEISASEKLARKNKAREGRKQRKRNRRK
jgi:signal recognition particle subunit SRP54